MVLSWLCVYATNFIRQSLTSAGFFINEKKSILHAVQEIEWLGLIWRYFNFSLCIPQRRKFDLELCLERVEYALPNVSARIVAQLTVKILYILPVMGYVVRLMSRSCHVAFESRFSSNKT